MGQRTTQNCDPQENENNKPRKFPSWGHRKWAQGLMTSPAV